MPDQSLRDTQLLPVDNPVQIGALKKNGILQIVTKYGRNKFILE